MTHITDQVLNEIGVGREAWATECEGFARRVIAIRRAIREREFQMAENLCLNLIVDLTADPEQRREGAIEAASSLQWQRECAAGLHEAPVAPEWRVKPPDDLPF